jgi:hypothetical protein
VNRAGRGLLLVAGLGALGCAHGEPFSPDAADTLGPAASALPRRLTFNVGDDRSPAAIGTEVVYSRYDPSRATPAQCLARLPAEGGTLTSLRCPPPPTPADTFVGTWLEPALSDDGQSVAFVWQRGARVSALAAWTHHLVVAPADSPAAPRHEILLAGSIGGAFYNTATKLTWAGPGRVRFLAAYDSIFKVKDGGADRFTDTVAVPRGLAELDVATGTIGPVAGPVSAYTVGPDGAPWVPDADTLKRVADQWTPIVALGGPVTDLAAADGYVVAARGDPAAYWWDLTDGTSGAIVLPGPVRRIAAVGGRRLVAEVEVDGRVFGAPANLWLFELPARSGR